MLRAYFLPKDLPGQVIWLQNFSTKLPTHMAALGLDQAKIDAVLADAAFLVFVISSLTSYREKSKEWTAFKNLMTGGDQDAPVTIPNTITLNPTAMVAAGILTRITDLVKQIKANDNYNEAMGQDLGVIGEEIDTDTTDIKPELSAKFTGNQWDVNWKKGIADGIKFFLDKGDGNGFQFLDYDFRPNYTIKEPLPAAGQSAVWKLKAIYVDNDTEEIGQWSDVISFTVSGAV